MVKTRHEIVLNSLSCLIIVAQIIFLLIKWPSISNEVPTHFNLAGIPDGFGSKYNLLLLPIVSVGLFYGMRALYRIKYDGYLANYDENIANKLFSLYRSWTSLTLTGTTLFFFSLLYFSIQNSRDIPNWIIIIYFSVLLGSVVVYGIREVFLKKNSKHH
ncbi:DUF1648 domain-containing protein [Kurthia huakuii]|uniref:DUF1648 domain-containing protein n=1 Tax=Kurthia huakuii TaxID=1421019 RepID=UPI00068624CA|nr:DUF1648 domain-containing protein [Kurthia huakuii]MBM7701126.1 putative membrane protein [Kurthia huakuii]